MYYESYYEYIPKKKIFFLNFYLRFLVPLKFEFGHDIYIIRKLMKNSIDLGSYMLKKSILKKKFFCLSMALTGLFQAKTEKLKPLEIELRRLEDLSDSIVNGKFIP